MSRPFAAFDIDGTIIRWQLYHAIADELAKRGHLTPEQFATVRVARMTWKQRSHTDAFDEYEMTLVRVMEKALHTLKASDVQAASCAVIEEYKDQVYTFSRQLLAELKAKNYLLFAISASQDDIVRLLAEHYGFDDYGGTKYEVVNDHFTGERDLMRSARKPEYLRELVAKHDADWQGSIAVGDSEGDIPMLSTVEQPIAFNPSQKLFDHAKAHGWRVVLERKNVVYQLEPQDGSYLLAQTGPR